MDIEKNITSKGGGGGGGKRGTVTTLPRRVKPALVQRRRNVGDKHTVAVGSSSTTSSTTTSSSSNTNNSTTSSKTKSRVNGLITFYHNRPHSKGVKVVVGRQLFEKLLDRLSQSFSIAGGVQRLYTVHGQRLETITEITESGESILIACGSKDRFDPSRLPSALPPSLVSQNQNRHSRAELNSSPRVLLPPIRSGSKHVTPGGKAEHINDSNLGGISATSDGIDGAGNSGGKVLSNQTSPLAHNKGSPSAVISATTSPAYSGSNNNSFNNSVRSSDGYSPSSSPPKATVHSGSGEITKPEDLPTGNGNNGDGDSAPAVLLFPGTVTKQPVQKVVAVAAMSPPVTVGDAPSVAIPTVAASVRLRARPSIGSGSGGEGGGGGGGGSGGSSGITSPFTSPDLSPATSPSLATRKASSLASFTLGGENPSSRSRLSSVTNASAALEAFEAAAAVASTSGEAYFPVAVAAAAAAAARTSSLSSSSRSSPAPVVISGQNLNAREVTLSMATSTSEEGLGENRNLSTPVDAHELSQRLKEEDARQQQMRMFEEKQQLQQQDGFGSNNNSVVLLNDAAVDPTPNEATDATLAPPHPHMLQATQRRAQTLHSAVSPTSSFTSAASTVRGNTGHTSNSEEYSGEDLWLHDEIIFSDRLGSSGTRRGSAMSLASSGGRLSDLGFDGSFTSLLGAVGAAGRVQSSTGREISMEEQLAQLAGSLQHMAHYVESLEARLRLHEPSLRSRISAPDYIGYYAGRKWIDAWVPSAHAPTLEDTLLPEQTLVPDYCFGWPRRPKDVLFIGRDTAVYPMARGVLIHGVDRGTQSFYAEHTAAVCSLTAGAAGEDGDFKFNGDGGGGGGDGDGDSGSGNTGGSSAGLIASAQLANRRSGQHSASVRVWRMRNLETLGTFEVGDRVRGISGLAFAPGSADHLLTLDSRTEGNICLRVWNWRSGKLLAVTPIIDPVTKNLVSSSSLSDGQVHELLVSKTSICTYTSAGAVLWELDIVMPCIKIVASASFSKELLLTRLCPGPDTASWLVAADDNGGLHEWDLAFGTAPQRVLSHAHDGALTAVWTGTAGLITAGVDGLVRSWDWNYRPQTLGGEDSEYDLGTGAPQRVLAALQGLTGVRVLCASDMGLTSITCHNGQQTVVMGGHTGSVSGLTLHPDRADVFVAVDSEGTVHAWDARKRNSIWSASLPSADDVPTCIAVRPGEGDIAIGLDDGLLVVMDHSGRVHYEIELGSSAVTSLQYSPDARLLAAGSADGTICIYDCDRQCALRGRCVGHLGPVVQIDWTSVRHAVIRACGGDQVSYWNAENCRRLPNRRKWANELWHTCTCTLGWQVRALTPPLSQPAAPRCIDAARSRDGAVLVAGDASGTLRLFRYPAYAPNAQAHLYKVHVGPIRRVCFSRSDDYVASIAGDGFLMIWKVSRPGS